MTSLNLEAKCRRMLGIKDGSVLFELMQTISKKDFCVATGWTAGEISIAKGCFQNGQIFKIGGAPGTIISPDGTCIDVNKAAYEDIARYLPPKPPRLDYQDREKHCKVDDN